MIKVRSALAAGLIALVLSACATPPVEANPSSEAPSPEQTQSYKACLVTDADQATDGSPTSEAINGLDWAQRELGIETNHVIAANQADYARILQAQVDSSCNMIIGLGTPIADAIEAAAKTNPNVKFALIDATPNSAPNNLRPVLFSTHESGFLAGYLAASVSTSGKVGTFGSLNMPAVSIYMDGFVQGVDYYNEQNSGTVEALGWSLEAQDGTFVRSDTTPYDDPVAGKAAAQSLVDEGADVILAVAGYSGVGALELAKESDDLRIIWSDTNGCLTQPEFCEQLLGSVVKDRASAIFEVIRADHEGNSAAGVFSANLRNGGTDLIEGRPGEFTPQITGELDAVTKEIVDGVVTVVSPSAIG